MRAGSGFAGPALAFPRGRCLFLFAIATTPRDRSPAAHRRERALRAELRRLARAALGRPSAKDYQWLREAEDRLGWHHGSSMPKKANQGNHRSAFSQMANFAAGYGPWAVPQPSPWLGGHGGQGGYGGFTVPVRGGAGNGAWQVAGARRNRWRCECCGKFNSGALQACKYCFPALPKAKPKRKAGRGNGKDGRRAHQAKDNAKQQAEGGQELDQKIAAAKLLGEPAKALLDTLLAEKEQAKEAAKQQNPSKALRASLHELQNAQQRVQAAHAKREKAQAALDAAQKRLNEAQDDVHIAEDQEQRTRASFESAAASAKQDQEPVALLRALQEKLSNKSNAASFQGFIQWLESEVVQDTAKRAAAEALAEAAAKKAEAYVMSEEEEDAESAMSTPRGRHRSPASASGPRRERDRTPRRSAAAK